MVVAQVIRRSKRQRAKSNEQRAKSKEKRARSKEKTRSEVAGQETARRAAAGHETGAGGRCVTRDCCGSR